MATIRLPPDFSEFLKLLHSEKVEYLLIGGYAVAYHGYTRATGDMDIWIAMNPENARRVVRALRRFGFTDMPISTDLFLKENQVIRMGVPPLRIELLTTISGVSFAQCFARRQTAVLEDLEVNMIGLDDLKTNKKASGRLRDLNDLENLA